MPKSIQMNLKKDIEYLFIFAELFSNGWFEKILGKIDIFFMLFPLNHGWFESIYDQYLK